MGRKLEFDRRKALETAMEGFWRSGYEETSMRGLAERLKLHPGSVYNALGGKEKLFEEALRMHFDEWVGPRLKALAENPDPLAALDAYLAATAEECANPSESFGCFVMNSLHEIAKINDRITALLHEGIARMEDAFEDCVARAMASGAIAPGRESRQLARFLVATQFAMRAMAKIGSPPEKIEDVRHCAVQALKG